MRYFLILIMPVQGAIHLMGFAKAFHDGNMSATSNQLSRPVGILWLLASALFTSASVLVLLKKNEWCMVGIPAVTFSQMLILSVWSDAKYGTVVNALILIAILAFSYERYH